MERPRANASSLQCAERKKELSRQAEAERKSPAESRQSQSGFPKPARKGQRSRANHQRRSRRDANRQAGSQPEESLLQRSRPEENRQQRDASSATVEQKKSLGDAEAFSSAGKLTEVRQIRRLPSDQLEQAFLHPVLQLSRPRATHCDQVRNSRASPFVPANQDEKFPPKSLPCP